MIRSGYRPLLLVMGLLAGGLPAVLAGTAWAQADVIAERQAGFKRMGAALAAYKKGLDDGAPVASLAPRAEEMVAWFSTLPSHFPAGSDKGETKALPAIWSDSTGFATAAGNAAKAAESLRTASMAGDEAATKTAFTAMAGTCGACHRQFRGR